MSTDHWAVEQVADILHYFKLGEDKMKTTKTEGGYCCEWNGKTTFAGTRVAAMSAMLERE